MRGETVIVRALGGEPLVRRVWHATADAVFICSEETFRRLQAGFTDIWPIGFPIEDVFCYDAAVVPLLQEAWRTNPAIWDRLVLWADQAPAK